MEATQFEAGTLVAHTKFPRSSVAQTSIAARIPARPLGNTEVDLPRQMSLPKGHEVCADSTDDFGEAYTRGLVGIGVEPRNLSLSGSDKRPTRPFIELSRLILIQSGGISTTIQSFLHSGIGQASSQVS